jgi:competence protein ComEA helix-hairpin-helix repeat region
MKRLLTILVLCPVYAFAAPVNVNRADAETISESLTGIGPKKADAIVQYRKEHGDFQSLKDLENVSGIGEKTLQANEKDIRFTDDLSDKSSAEKGAVVVDKKGAR